MFKTKQLKVIHEPRGIEEGLLFQVHSNSLFTPSSTNETITPRLPSTESCRSYTQTPS